MEASPSAFFFRNRRWLLMSLFFVAFLASSFPNRPMAARLARFLAGHASPAGSSFWPHALFGLCAVLLALGGFWRTWGSAYLGTHVVQDRQLHTERLVADGPYRYCRNPLYLGNMFVVFGIGFLLRPAAALLLVLGMWILLRMIIRDEEAALAVSGGENYRAYCAAVPRLFPSFRPRIPPAGARPRWLQGIGGEIWIWVLTAAAAGVAATLDPAWFQVRLLWGCLIALPFFLWARRSSRRPAATTGPA